MSAYTDAVDALSPVHYWQFDGNANDTGTGTTLNGTATNMEYEAGVVCLGSANHASFNLDGNISIASSADLNNQTITAFTLSMWIRPSLDTLCSTGFRVGSSTVGWYLNVSAGLIPIVNFISGSVGEPHYGEKMRINEPTHLVLTYNAGTVQLWQNGVKTLDYTSSYTSLTGTTAASNFGNGESSRVAGDTFTYYDLHADLSNVAYWNTVQSDSVITDTLFALGRQPVSRAINFTNMPLKTEARVFDIDNSLNELGGIEFVTALTGDSYTVPFNVDDVFNARIALINVEGVFDIFYSDVALGRQDYDFDASLLLKQDRVYSNDGWVQPIPPSNITVPFITGNPTPGSDLTVNPGVWDGAPSPTLSYQWYRDGSIIPGETGLTYTVQASDEDLPLFCRETATNASGTEFVDTGSRTYINTKIYGIWYDATGSQVPGTAFSKFTFDGETENINASFSTANNQDFELPAGNWLVIATLKYENTTNGRTNPEARVQYTGSGDNLVVYGTGFSRDSNNFTSFVRTMSYVRNATAGDTVSIEHRRDSDTMTGGSVANYCHLQIINVDALTMGAYKDVTNASAYGLTSFSTITWDTTVVENGANITRSGNTITLAANKVYLIAYGIAFGTGGSRTQRISRAFINGSAVPASYSYCYQRNSSNEYGDIGSIFMYQTGGTSEALTFEAALGDADVAGSMVRRPDTSHCFILELDTPTWYSSSDSAGNQDVTGTVDQPMNVFESELHTDPAFTKNSQTQITKNGAGYVLMGASVFANQPSTSGGTRLSRGLKFTVSGAEVQVGQAGNYLRGNQSTQDTYDISLGATGVVFLQDSDTVEVEIFDSGQDGTSPTSTIANRSGFWALDINSI